MVGTLTRAGESVVEVLEDIFESKEEMSNVFKRIEVCCMKILQASDIRVTGFSTRL